MGAVLGYTFRDMGVGQLVLWFFIYSFFGWAMECVVIRKQLGYWENRGFAKLPFCVIYGFGTFIAFNLFGPIEHNFIALYIFGAICATAFEYLTAVIMLKLFGEVWWNYDHLKFNYKGVLCLQSTLGWGFLAIFIFGFFNRLVEKFVFMVDVKYANALAAVLVISYVIDFTFHFAKSIEASGKLDSIEEKMSRLIRR